MLRNVPSDYTRAILLDLLAAECPEGSYDFVYLPTVFETGYNLGFAFVNFAWPEAADAFRRAHCGVLQCEATWSALQGLQAHLERYRSSPVMHACVPEACRPVLLRGGERAAFPPPTRRVKAPRAWDRKACAPPGEG